MAHSGAGATTSEINYFYQDENGKVVKVMKPAQIKTETLGGGTTYCYNHQENYVRIPNNYDMKSNNQYTAITGPSGSAVGGMQHQSGAIHKYEMNAAKNEERYVKYPQQNCITKAKVKLHNNHNNAANNHNTDATASSAVSHPSSSHHHAYKVQKKRKPEKAGKGLRHFSMKVCEKVKEKGATTYNEVADELVAEEIQNHSLDSANCDQKNIRRRVYDALNVLMAMQIISKDKKEIRWIGLPSNKHENCADIETRIEEQRESIERKHQQLRELLLQYVSFKGLVERNKQAERQGIVPTNNSSIQLPFIIVNTHKSTKINCSVTNDKSEYIFKFDDKFEMHDDAEVLKHMGLLAGLDKGQCSYEDIERFKMLVPPNFVKYIEAYGNGKGVSCDSDDEMPSFIDNDTQDSMHADGTKSPDLDKEFLTNSDVD